MTYPHLTQLARQYKFILASGSPRRYDLLAETGVAFERVVPELHEHRQPGEEPIAFAQRLAEEKALEVGRQVDDGQMILGCDTIVVLGDMILGKPRDEIEAAKTLRILSGKQHVVCTAVAFVANGQVVASGADTTRVYFNDVTEEEIQDYIDSGEPADKAGAYGIQGMGAFLVDRIEGQLDTVIGLPRNLLDALARTVTSRLQRG